VKFTVTFKVTFKTEFKTETPISNGPLLRLPPAALRPFSGPNVAGPLSDRVDVGRTQVGERRQQVVVRLEPLRRDLAV
jgi:hypothetical protein